MKYQPNVAAILRRSDGRIFIGERVATPGAWQFPQGGVDDGQSHEEAMRRELWEEIGVKPEHYTLADKRGPYHYLFPAGLTKRGHNGKEQYYFLCEYLASDAEIDVATPHPEFRDWRWIKPEEFSLAWLPEMKVEVYRRVFQDFFGVRL